MGLFFDLLYRLLIYPLELIFEVVYTLAEKQIRDPGLSIIVLSLVMIILVLPLYMKADRLQEEAREKESRLAPAGRRIRETIAGYSIEPFHCTLMVKDLSFIFEMIY